MSEFKLERFKYNWLGEWQPNYSYNKDDIVRVGAKTYVCFKQHVSNADFNIDLEAIIPDSNPPLPDIHWKVMTSSQAFIGKWQSSYQYQLGDIVLYNGSLYLCNDGHFSTLFQEQVNNWNLFISGSEFVKNWQPNTAYGAGAIVSYNGLNYRCIISHTSNDLIEIDENNWQLYTAGYYFVGDFAPNTFYKKNDYVNFGGSIYTVITSHVSGAEFYRHYFEIAIPGYVYAAEWSSSVYYGVGDTVSFGGSWYVCLASNVNVAPTNIDDSIEYWDKLVTSNSLTGNFLVGKEYKPGDLALFGGELYECQQILTAVSIDEVSEPSKWKIFIPGQKWTNFWKTDIQFYVNDITYFLGQAWKCNTPHISNSNNFPGDNGKGNFYWDLLIQSGDEAGLNYIGDLLTYDFQREVIGDYSSIGTTGLQIGTQDQLLSVNNDFTLFWRTLHQTETTVVYVNQTGIDAEGRGLDPYHAFKSIQYACRFVEENNIMPCKIAVATGLYEEVLPIVIPKMTVVMGDELRSTTIKPAKATNDDSAITFRYLNRLRGIIPNIVNQIPISTSEGNILEPNFPSTSISDTDQPTNLLNNLFIDIEQNIVAIFAGNNSNIEITGSNDFSPNNFIDYANVIENNIEFLTQEAYYYTISTTLIDVENIDYQKIIKDSRMFITAFIYDLKYLGNYKTIRYSTIYANHIKGSEKENMFLVRDITGLRQCTVEGLTGELTGDPALIDTTRVTGGAFISLDPGWGPDHREAWIQNRSPYIQGVTTIGTGCIGAHIDGILHNGGNRSIVANDFTQVLSDGIGAYILNRGRVELVSVFTYYCYAGYLAQNGGTIRATNGNNSYGQYGCVALGIDDAETPAYAKTNTQTTDASVYQAFAGEISDDSGDLDRLLVFEYSHCGEEYSNASATIVGSGNFAVAKFEDFRNGGIKEFRLLEPQDSTRIGGLGYTNRKNNCQTGTEFDIVLSATDLFTADDYVGQRIVITSGPGTGQYGYIQAYDDNDASLTYRTATVYRESDDQPGWDHIVPGTPSAVLLTASTSYSIEPRLIMQHPGFETTAGLLSNAKLWTDIAWGATTETFIVSLEFGSGDVIGLIPLKAVANITKIGKNYNVILTNAGTAYAENDTFTILGENLGGVTGENDLIIKVTEVTDDSSSSIVTFEAVGEALEGKWLVISDGNFSGYSTDGSTWTEIFLPIIQSWKKISTGNGTFVAIATGLSSTIAYSKTGTNWGQASLPSTKNVKDIVFGNGIFVILTNTSSTFFSIDGTTWEESLIPNSITTNWVVITFAFNKFCALSNDGAEAIGTWDEENNQINWEVTASVIPNNPETGLPYNLLSISSNGGQILALTDADSVVYCIVESFGVYSSVSIPNGNYNKIQYSNGLYFLTGITNTDKLPISENGINWTEQLLPNSNAWSAIQFGWTSNKNYHYGLIAYNDSNLLTIKTGKRAIARAKITSSTFDAIVIWDPGSGYNDSNDYELEIVDNSWISQVFQTVRIGDRVLSQPTFISRGIGYRSSTTRITITGDGFADIIPSNETNIIVDGLTKYPGPGAQLRIDGIYDEENPDELRIITLVTINPLGLDESINGTFKAEFRVSPKIQNKDLLTNDRLIEIRERYSQCRVTGHDFLDIGTGNFIDTNYPDLYASGAFFIAKPEQEVIENNGGRVFYVSTDQDGNFRTGELFAVEQATGIVTISADFFNLDGLSELSLGGVRLGGSGTVVREFSTDVNFFADSDNIIPTQRAIVTFVESRISAGGGEVLTNELIAGQVKVGTNDNLFSTTTGFKLNVDKRIDFIGSSNKGVKGFPLALSYYFRDIER